MKIRAPGAAPSWIEHDGARFMFDPMTAADDFEFTRVMGEVLELGVRRLHRLSREATGLATALVARKLAGWDGVTDPDGNPIGFDRDLVPRLFTSGQLLSLFFDLYKSSQLTPADRKN